MENLKFISLFLVQKALQGELLSRRQNDQSHSKHKHAQIEESSESLRKPLFFWLLIIRFHVWFEYMKLIEK